MEWLTPLTAIYAAAITVPLLLLLYFLKLKRREHVVSSTLLWKRAIQDLQVNAPFQKLRRNILLLLQMLALLVILAALGGPVLSMTAGPAKRYVLLIDRSASMSATDVKPSRLEEAKKMAKVFVDSIRGESFFSLRGGGDQVMVIAFDNYAKVMCNFTADKKQLAMAIDSISLTDSCSSLSEAIVVARAFAQSPGVDMNNRSAQNFAQLILFSDGRINDADKIDVVSDEMVFNRIGTSGENVAVTAMSARRSYEQPDEVHVFAGISNYNKEAVTCDVQLSINGDVRSVRTISLEPCQAEKESEPVRPGKATVNFTFSHPEAAVIEVRCLKEDIFSADNAAWSIVSGPRKLSVLLVTEGNMVLETAFRSCPLGRFHVISPKEFEGLDPTVLMVEQSYDIIVFDRYSPSSYPVCRYIVFGRPPAGIDVEVIKELENQTIVDWQQNHPVLQYVNLINLFAAKCYEMKLPRDAEVLAEFNECAAIAVLRRNGSFFLLAGFDILQSNWPFEPSLVLFCYNALSYLGTETGLGLATDLKVGEPIIVEGVEGNIKAVITGPGVSHREIEASAAGIIRFPNTERCGVYGLELSGQPLKYFAVNLLDGYESNIEPADEIKLSGETIKAQERPMARGNVPLWPLLVAAALVLACIEWFVYNSKVRI